MNPDTFGNFKFRWVTSLLLSVFCSSYVSGQNMQVHDLPDILNKINSGQDSTLSFSRECSILFHKKLNAYRKENQLKELLWNDTLWLAALNHSVYLDKNLLFSHSEDPHLPCFTGINPGERYQFVLAGSAQSSSCGENIFMMSGVRYTSGEIASMMFNTWKNSEGHNRNMLYNSYYDHAVCAYFGNQGLIATDIFSTSKCYPVQYADNDQKAHVSKHKPIQEKEHAAKISSREFRKQWELMQIAQIPQLLKNSKHNLKNRAEKTNSEFMNECVRDKQLKRRIGNNSLYSENQTRQIKFSFPKSIFNKFLTKQFLFIAIRNDNLNFDKPKNLIQQFFDNFYPAGRQKGKIHAAGNAIWKKKGNYYYISAVIIHLEK